MSGAERFGKYVRIVYDLVLADYRTGSVNYHNLGAQLCCFVEQLNERPRARLRSAPFAVSITNYPKMLRICLELEVHDDIKC